MILEVFINFLGSNSHWMIKKNICNLIIAVGFNFDANMTVRSFLNRWNQSITIGSNQDFKMNTYRISG